MRDLRVGDVHRLRHPTRRRNRCPRCRSWMSNGQTLNCRRCAVTFDQVSDSTYEVVTSGGT